MDNIIYEFDEEKSSKLLAERGLGFEELITFIDSNKLVATINSNQDQYPGQKIFVINVDDYIWYVPHFHYGDRIRLITAWPTRKGTSLWLDKGTGYDNDN